MNKNVSQFEVFSQLINLIPPEITSLLWFADGLLKNYSSEKLPMFKTDFFTVTFSQEVEPSLIRTTDPIGLTVSPAPALGYYPSYSRMTPNERATYLNWLCNVDDEIDMGYVFVFYYGLERHLAMKDVKNFERAFEMILRLRAHHKKGTFEGYSSTALIASTLIHNRPDLLNKLLCEEIQLTSLFCYDSFLLACLAKCNLCLNADAIIEMANNVGFFDKYYIRKKPDEFRQVLTKLLAERFSEKGYPLTESHLSESPLKEETIFANWSLNRYITIPDITKNETLKNDLNKLLVETHEILKVAPRKKREKKR